MAFRPALVTGKLQACLRIARGGAQAFHGPFWSPAARQRRGFSVDRLKESLALHAEVSRCVFIENVAYVVRKQESTKAMLLDESVGDWELEKHLMRKATDWGIPQELVPKVRVLDELPGPESFVVPFSLLRMLHVLFQEVDASQSNHICLQEFLSFCKKTQIFTADEASQVFLSKRSLPSTSELLFSENDIFHLNNEYDTDKAIKFNDFQQLILDAGILDFTSFRAIGDPLGSPLVSFFVDERVLQIILAHWFALYDFNQDGRLQLEEYARLVADYQLPLTAADEIYTRAIKDRMVGLDMLDFQALLVKSGVLATGTSIEKDDEMGRNWRQIEDGRQFKGMWKDAKIHGSGEYQWPNGRSFCGQYLEDQKEGFGIFTWKDGKQFQGFWKAGKQHGPGVMYAGDGTVIKEGVWHEGCAPDGGTSPVK